MGDFELVDFESSRHDELMPLVEYLGLQGVKNPRSLTVRRGDFEVTVRLEIHRGYVTGCTATSAWRQEGGGAFLALRRETVIDRADKESGLVVELQLASRVFDERVFIDTDAPEEVVRGMLPGGSRRQAVHELVGLCRVIRFERSALRLEFGNPTRGDEPGRRLARALELMQAAWDIGPVPAAPVGRPGDAALGFALLGTLGTGTAFAFAAMSWTIALGPQLLLLLAFFVAGGVTWPLARGLVAGHSGSGRDARRLVLLFCAMLSFAGNALFLGLNGLLGESETVEVRGHVVAIDELSGKKGRWRVLIQWRDDSSSTHEFRAQPREGMAAVKELHRGLLLPWGERAGLEWQPERQRKSARPTPP